MWHSSLSRDRHDIFLRISEDGPSFEEFNSDASTDCWDCDKICRLSTGPHNYASKHKKSRDSKELIQPEMLTFSNLVNNEKDVDVDFN